MPSAEERIAMLEAQVARHERILCRVVRCLRAVWPVIGSVIAGLIARHLWGH